MSVCVLHCDDKKFLHIALLAKRSETIFAANDGDQIYQKGGEVAVSTYCKERQLFTSCCSWQHYYYQSSCDTSPALSDFAYIIRVCACAVQTVSVTTVLSTCVSSQQLVRVPFSVWVTVLSFTCCLIMWLLMVLVFFLSLTSDGSCLALFQACAR